MLIFVKSSSAIVPSTEFYVDPDGTTSSHDFNSCSNSESNPLPRNITNLRGISSQSIDAFFVSHTTQSLFLLFIASAFVFHIFLPPLHMRPDYVAV